MNHLNNALKVFIGIALLVTLYYLIGVSSVLQQIPSVNLFWVGLAMALLILSLVLNGINVWISVWPLKKIRLAKAIQYYFFSWAIGFWAPGKLGDFTIIPMLKKQGISTGPATASAIINKIVSLATLLALSAVGLVFFLGFSYAFQAVLAGMLVVSVLGLLVATPNGRNVLKKIAGKKSSWFLGFGNAMDPYFSKHLGLVALNALVTLVQWIVLVIFTMALFWGFGFFPGFWDVLFVASISSLVSLIPISPNGIGVREVTYTFLAGLRGWPSVTTVSVITVSLAIHYAIVITVLVFFAREIKHLTENTSNAHEREIA